MCSPALTQLRYQVRYQLVVLEWLLLLNGYALVGVAILPFFRPHEASGAAFAILPLLSLAGIPFAAILISVHPSYSLNLTDFFKTRPLDDVDIALSIVIRAGVTLIVPCLCALATGLVALVLTDRLFHRFFFFDLNEYEYYLPHAGPTLFLFSVGALMIASTELILAQTLTIAFGRKAHLMSLSLCLLALGGLFVAILPTLLCVNGYEAFLSCCYLLLITGLSLKSVIAAIVCLLLLRAGYVGPWCIGRVIVAWIVSAFGLFAAVLLVSPADGFADDFLAGMLVLMMPLATPLALRWAIAHARHR